MQTTESRKRVPILHIQIYYEHDAFFIVFGCGLLMFDFGHSLQWHSLALEQL